MQNVSIDKSAELYSYDVTGGQIDFKVNKTGLLLLEF